MSCLLPLPRGRLLSAAGLAAVPFTLPLLFLTFLKIGAVLYGSGYVLLAFLRSDLVVRYAWLTDQQLLDAVAVGQVTPGPLFTTATFIGYVLAGVPGALLATLGIFLPSFCLCGCLESAHPQAAQLALGGQLPGWRQRRGPRADGRRDVAIGPRVDGRSPHRSGSHWPPWHCCCASRSIRPG